MEKGKSLVNVDVEKALSSVWVKMPCVNVEIQMVILPSVSQILYQVETIVSSSSQSLDEATDLWWDKSEVHLEESYGQDDYDSHHLDVFLFSDATSTSSRPSPSLYPSYPSFGLSARVSRSSSEELSRSSSAAGELSRSSSVESSRLSSGELSRSSPVEASISSSVKSSRSSSEESSRSSSVKSSRSSSVKSSRSSSEESSRSSSVESSRFSLVESSRSSDT